MIARGFRVLIYQGPEDWVDMCLTHRNNFVRPDRPYTCGTDNNPCSITELVTEGSILQFVKQQGETTMQKFWYVAKESDWRSGPAGSGWHLVSPFTQHLTKQQAITYARSLAQIHPGVRYAVFAFEGAAGPIQPAPIWTDAH